MAAHLKDSVLAPPDRQTWLDWMSGNATGRTLIRAGSPERWAVADKSGGAGAIRSDIPIVTPPGRFPIVVTILTTKNDPNAEFGDALVADSAKLVRDTFR